MLVPPTEMLRYEFIHQLMIKLRLPPARAEVNYSPVDE
jgi:hypothetical protein